MDINKIKQAQSNLKIYFDDGLIKKQKFDKLVYDTYMKNHTESIEVAQKLLDDDVSDLWVIVSSYYSMFYIANAYLVSIGLKIGHKIAHKVTADSLIVYLKEHIEDNLIENYELLAGDALSISENLVESFEFERVKRSKIQYETTDNIKKYKAETSIRRAKLFALEIEKLFEE
ncbi:MAG: hypothetical protein HRU03_09040 [Nanoarchaeales archaeon]|nr:hypothetical protein [Nanoarchaeales archaeon]